MIEGKWLRGLLVALVLLVPSVVFAQSPYTSVQSGNWNDDNTWSGTGIPTTGDQVTIVSNHTVTVTGVQAASRVTLQSGLGSKTLVLSSGGSLTLGFTGNALQVDGSSDGINIVDFDGGSLTTSGGSINVNAGGLNLARIHFTSNGGTLTANGNLTFSGTATNAQIQFDSGSPGVVQITGTLGSGGNILTNNAGTFRFNGTVGQTINAYTFNNLEINRVSGTATLNGPVTVNGNLDITSGVLDDGGNQISLNAGSTSNVTIGLNGVLKLGSSGSATFFPTPVIGANVTMSTNAAVVYQAGQTGQIVDLNVAYRRLFLQAPGSTGPVDKMIGSGTLKVQELLQIDDNGGNDVRLMLGPEILDADADIIGSGEIFVTSGSIFVGGTFSTTTLTLGGSGSTVTYDGPGAQNILPTTYDHLVVNKSGGQATPLGPVTVNGNLTITAGTLYDGGYQISLDSGSGSLVAMGGAGILKLGSSVTATTFPTPVTPANVTLAPGSTVIYQGDSSQQVNTSFDYRRLVFATVIGAVTRSFVNQTLLTVLDEFFIDTNVEASFDNDLLDVDGDISGSGTLHLKNTVSPGNLQLGGNWAIASNLLAAPGTTVTYDGAGSQSMLDATYRNLTLNKASGSASIGSGGVDGTLTLNGGNIDIGSSFMIDVGASVNHTAGYFTGPLTMGFNISSPRRFHIGTSTSYLPVDADAGSAGTLTVEAVGGPAPNSTGPNQLARYWRIVAPSTATPINILTFNYSAADVGPGDETRYRLAQQSGGFWTQHGDLVDEALNLATITNVSSYLSDWVIGQRGSQGLAGQLAITSVNGGSDPIANTPFSVTVKSQYDNGAPANVTAGTTVDVLLNVGSGSLLTQSGTIGTGSSSTTVNNLTYNQAENGVQLKADAVSGDPLDDGLSPTFNVLSGSSISVTSILDSGPGTLRDVITQVNLGNCPTPCTVDFDVNGTGTITLASPLPPLTANAVNLTIDGYTGFGAAVNSATFGAASNANITVIVDGNNVVPIGLELQTSGVTIRGLGFRGFNSGGTGEAIKINNTAGNTVEGCFIGNNGVTATPNWAGVVIFGPGASGNTVGGPTPDKLNVISGNSSWGIDLASSASSNVIETNYIGVRADGAGALANGPGGARICASCSSNSIGSSGLGNIISGHNPGVGIQVNGTLSLIEGNFIGLNAAGNGAVPNGIGVVLDGDDNYLGGTGVGQRNYISGNADVGLLINSDDNDICNNYIGLDVTSAPVANSSHGVQVALTAAGNEIGSPAGNTIASNGGRGIQLTTSGIGNVMRKNVIRQNTNIAIDLGGDGATANDATDTDTGANNRQNFPTVADARINGGNIDVKFSINSSGGVSVGGFLIDVYEADASVTPQAGAYIGTSNCLAGPTLSNAVVSLAAGGLTVGSKIVTTATAFSDPTCTTPTEGTSELSPGSIVAGDVHWVAGSGSFETPGNWDVGVVPGAGDNAFIDNSGTYTVTMSSTHALNSLHVGVIGGTQQLDLGAGTTLTVNAPSDVTGSGVLNLGGSLLTGGGSLDVGSGGTMTWTTGNISGGAALNVNASGTLNINSAASKTLTGRLLTIANSANVNWNGGDLSLATGAAINNAGSFVISTDSILQNGGGGGAFTNSGTSLLRKQTTAGTTTFTNVPLNHNAGTLDLQTGTLDLASATIASTVSLAPATELLINDNSVAINSGASFSSTGVLRVNGGTLNINTPVTIAKVTLDTGTLDGAAVLTVPSGGIFTWNGGTMQGAGTTKIAGSGSLQLNGASAKSLSQRTIQLLSGGSATWSDGTLQLAAGGNIDDAGTFVITGNTPLTNSGAGAFVVQPGGILRKATGTGTTQFSNTTVTNNGTLDLQTGTFDPATLNSSAAVALNGGAVLLVNSDVATLSSGSSITGAGSLQITAATLTIDASTNLPKLQIDGGTVNGSGTFTCDSLAWGAGTLSGSGTTQIGSGQSMFIATGSAKSLSRPLAISNALGTATVNGTGTLTLTAGGSISNAGTFLVTADMNITGSGQSITNSGTFRKSTGTGTLLISNVSFDNSGTLDVQNGIVDLAGGTSTSLFQIASSCEVLINSDSYNLNSGSSVTGAGKLKLTGGSLIVSGVPVQVDNYQQAGGILGGTGTLRVMTNGDWSTGAMQGAGSTLINGAFSLSGAAGKSLDTRTFSVSAPGTVTVNGTGPVTLSNGGNISNNGNFIVTADNLFNNGGSGGGFDNVGTFTKQTTTGTTTFANVAFTNHNNVDLQTGILNVTGAFSQPTGNLKLKFGGTTAGTQYSQLQTAANPSLAGTLQVVFNGVYEPNPGDSFLAVQIATGVHSGVFTPNYPAMCCGKTWTESYGASGLLLSVSGVADLTIAKNAPASVTSGNPITYTLTVNNGGPDPAVGATVTDVLQTGHTSIVPNGGAAWTCGVASLTVTCTANSNLATGPAQNITINANAPTAIGPFTNVANVTSTNDPNGGNNSGSAVVNVTPPNADLAVTAIGAPSPAPTATAVTYTFTITNNGPATATGVTFVATIPPGLTFTSSAPGGPTCTYSAPTLSCTLGSINNGNASNITINATTNAGGTQTVTGTASRAETDPNGANDTASASIAVTGGGSLTVINTNDSGSGSLRQALLDANGGVCTSPCAISFNIPSGPFVIQPATALPLVGTNTTVDARTQPGYSGTPIVELDGSLLAGGTSTLALNGTGAKIAGLAITKANISNFGISIAGNSNIVEANYIGLNPSGAAAGNDTGIRIDGNNNTIGGNTAAKRNIISSNSLGLLINGSAAGNTVAGNYVGIDPTGSIARGNAIGLEIASADSNTIGGATAADGNVVSANTTYGIKVFGANGSAIANTNTIRNNWVGPNAAGSAALGNIAAGIQIDNFTNATSIRDNVISGNQNALVLNGSSNTNTVIRGNLVGVAPDASTAMANVLSAISIADATTASIGGTGAGEPNSIANNGGNGITLTGTALKNTIIGNSIHDQTLLGIDLGNDGITANDATDSDSGPNGKQNAPNLTSATLDGVGGMRITHDIDSSGSGAGGILVEFYEADTSGEGKTFISRSCFATSAFGAGTSFSQPGFIALGDSVVATATSYADAACTTPADGTSEFSNVVTVTPCTPPSETISGPPSVCSLSIGNSATASGTGTTFSWSISNGTITSGTSSPTITFTAGASGVVGLTVNVTDGSGCPGFTTSNITIVPPPAVTITGPTTSCPGSSVTLDAGAGFSSYSWSTGASSQTISVNPSVDTIYSVTVTNGSGCSGTDTHTVTMNPVPTPTITGPTSTCALSPITLDAGAGYASYLWSGGQTSQTISVAPATMTTYSVTVTNGSGCSGTDSHTVNVSANPTATITAPSGVCPNSTGNSASVPTQPGATYAWNITNGTITGSAGNPSVTFTAGGSGTVTLNVTITVGSCTSSGSVNMPVTTPPVVNITGPTQSCPSTPFTLNAGPGFSSYLWSTGATSQTITVSQTAASTTYSVTVSNGGCAATDSHVVTLLPTASVTITAPATALPDTAGLVASVPNTPSATFAWAISNGTITSATNASSITFTAGSSGITTLTVTATLGGCPKVGQHIVGISAAANDEADLSVTKSAAATVPAGGVLVYTIGVNNAGPDFAGDVLVFDTLPAGTSLVSIDDGPWSCFAVQNNITCTGAAFVDQPSVITIAVTAPSQGGVITNNVSVSATIPDPNPANDHASVTTNVIGAPATCATVPPSLVAPANNASTTSPVTFQWSAVDGASEYDLWLVNNNLTSLAGSTSNTSLMRQVGSGTSSWFVIARFAGGCTPLRSAQRTFNVAEGGNCATHGAPQVTAPAAGANAGSPVTFSWTPVPQAIGYRVWIQVNGTAAQDIGTTDGAISLTAALPTGSIVAFVDAIFAACPTTRSAPIAFTVPRPDACASRASATPFAPANDATVTSSAVDFQWSAANGADGYRVWFSQDGATPAVLGTTTNETSLHATFGPGVVVWWIESLYEGCASTESTRLRFTIPQGQGCSTAAPTLLGPANGSAASNGEVTFSWTGVPGAISYELWLATAKGTPALVGTTTGTSLTRILGAGEFEWFVRVTVDRCPPRDSQLSRFTLQPPASCLDTKRPIAISPIEGAALASPVTFSWNRPSGATSFELFAIRGNGTPQLVTSTTATETSGVNLAAGSLRWFVRAHFNGCASLDSEERELEIVTAPAACAPLAAPVVNAPGQISSNVPFLIQWTPIAGATAYQLQLSGDAGFANAETITTTATQHDLTRTSTVYARVRAIDGSCHPVPTVSAFGPSAAIFILPQQGSEGAAPLTGGVVTFTIPIGAQFAGQTFTATTHDPWLSVVPASGIVGATGTNLLATANTTGLPVGSSLGSVTLTLTTPSGAGSIQSQGTTAVFPTVSVSLVTPVTPSPKSGPPPDALIIPAVAHADGINSKFQSDVRVSNTSPQLIKYQLTYTPSGGAGISAGKQTTFSIEPGRTVALDDILKSWFGTGGESSVGTLEIRPLTQTTTTTSSASLSGLANLVTFASSRTFNLTSNGTFGQYIPAVPYANFIGRALDLSKPTLLSLQQIAQSDRYRTNLGILEGSGNPASLLVRVFGDSGEKLAEFPVNLAGGEHTQLNGFLAQHGVSSLADGRVEIQVLSPGGKVTAYASVLDNQTSDPLLVTPVTLTDVGNTRWVVPGVADLNNGFANWQTDMRIFNAGTTAVDATLAFYSQGGSAAKTTTITIPAGQVKQLDKTLASVFGVTNDGGAVHLTTATPTRLITTARTYNQTTGGTYGQFISAVTPAEAAGVGSRPLQILQVEESTRFRSNIGLAEVTGNPVTIELAVIPPDVKFTAVTQLTLQPNEFRQIGSLLKSVGLDGTFNARVTIRAISGTGRVTAYASVIDALTNDPTYVPAQ